MCCGAAANIAHEGKQVADRKYIHTSSLIFLTSKIANMEMNKAVEAITAFAEGKQTVNIAFVNPHCLNIACESPEYKCVLQQSLLVLPDGIAQSGARILLVPFSVPKPELWIQHHLHELRVGAAIGVGGLFDFYSGRIPRAPRWKRETGLEWVFRLMQKPGRMWQRYIIGNPLFLYRVWRRRRMHGYDKRKT